MNKEAIIEKARMIVSEILRCAPEDLRPETSSMDIESWDSLSNINIIVSVEKAFGVQFALGEIQNLANFGEICSLIETKSA